MAGDVVVMLPQQPGVLLVQADRVLDREAAAAVVDQVDVEVADLAQAVAAERERVGQCAEAVLADVERRLAVTAWTGVSVRDNELAVEGPVQDRTQPLPVPVADLVQHQALPWREADPQLPALPADLPAVDREARTLRLGDRQRPQIGAQRRADVVRQVAARAGRDRARAVVLDLHDLHRREVHDRVQAIYGMGVRVVVEGRRTNRESTRKSPAAVSGRGVVADPPRLDGDQLGPCDPPQRQRRDEAGVGAHDVLAFGELAHRDRRLDAVDRAKSPRHPVGAGILRQLHDELKVAGARRSSATTKISTRQRTVGGSQASSRSLRGWCSEASTIRNGPEKPACVSQRSAQAPARSSSARSGGSSGDTARWAGSSSGDRRRSEELEVAIELPLGDLLVRQLSLSPLDLDEVVDVVAVTRSAEALTQSGVR